MMKRCSSILGSLRTLVHIKPILRCLTDFVAAVPTVNKLLYTFISRRANHGIQIFDSNWKDINC